MKLHQLLISTVAAAAILGGPSVAVTFAGDLYAEAPTFPAAKVASVAPKVETIVPKGAQYRLRSGKTGVRFVACNEKRTYAGGEIELHCVTFSPSRGWGASLRWVPKYQLAPLSGALPAEPVVSALR